MRECGYFVLLCSLVLSANPEVPRPRGVAGEKSSLYSSGVDFACFDGSAVIPFDQVNDDYCDCDDGSDEPGTSACSVGTFHCVNAGHAPMDIPSSRVNDGICDCCDGSDEYDSSVTCENTCQELGQAAREEAERRQKLEQEGHQIYLDYSKQGSEAKQEKQARLEELTKEKEDLEAIKNDLEEKKNELEAPEKEAKDKHQEEYEDEKAFREAEKNEEKITRAFQDLDDNGDLMLTVPEMQARPEFDIDSNGEVSEDEAKEHLEDNESVDYDTFKTNIWPNIKEIYMPPISETADPTEQPPPAVDSGDDENNQASDDNDDDDGYHADDDDEERYHDEEDEPQDIDDYGDDEEDDFAEDLEEKGDNGASSEEFPMPAYDEATQAMIDAADAAREEFKDAEQKFKDAEREVNDLQSVLHIDFGDAMQFFPLKGSCFEYTDREYTYKLCPFERASQRSKTGGSETSLGIWGRWDGPADDLYSVMLYERGQGCWNGPDRSVRLLIECGTANELYSAAEPNRCEYQFEFRSPAACTQPLQPTKDVHTEL